MACAWPKIANNNMNLKYEKQTRFGSYLVFSEHSNLIATKHSHAAFYNLSTVNLINSQPKRLCT
uniref:Uncharacterized protein n=1 Tax=Rhizophora mucronata TaxID=61149 RepID=A0A2P2IIK7_RHIMU